MTPEPKRRLETHLIEETNPIGVRHLYKGNIEELTTAQLVTNVLMSAIESGLLPNCDLLEEDEELEILVQEMLPVAAAKQDPESGYPGTPKQYLEEKMWLAERLVFDQLVERRLDRIIEAQDNPNRHILVAEQKANGFDEITGVGILKLVPNEKRSTLSSFYVQPSNEGGKVALSILRKCGEIIADHNDHCSAEERIERVELARYDVTENRQPAFSKITQLVNRLRPDTIITEKAEWKGCGITYFNTDIDTFNDLLAEFGNKMELFFNN